MEDDLHSIEAGLAAMKRHATEEAALVEADISFHVDILTATNNPFITVVLADPGGDAVGVRAVLARR